MVDCLTLLLTEGTFWAGLVCPWTNIFFEWFYVIMILGLELGIMIKYDNITAPATFGILVSVLMIGLNPAGISFYPIIMFAINIGAILYAVFFRGE